MHLCMKDTSPVLDTEIKNDNDFVSIKSTWTDLDPQLRVTELNLKFSSVTLTKTLENMSKKCEGRGLVQFWGSKEQYIQLVYFANFYSLFHSQFHSDYSLMTFVVGTYVSQCRTWVRLENGVLPYFGKRIQTFSIWIKNTYLKS